MQDDFLDLLAQLWLYPLPTELKELAQRVLVPYSTGLIKMDIDVEKRISIDLKPLTKDFLKTLRKASSELREKQKEIEKSSEKISCPHVSAISDVNKGRSKIVKNYYDTCRAFKSHLEQADKELQACKDGLDIKMLIKGYLSLLIAEYFSYFLDTPVKKFDLEDRFHSLRSTNNIFVKLNKWYYSAKGGKIYLDFKTKVSQDASLSSSDAKAFYDRLLHQLSQGARLPLEVTVVECGIGNGKFAADFLHTIRKLDEFRLSATPTSSIPSIYERLRYHCFDFSKKMLLAAEKNPELAEHARHVVFRQESLVEANFDYPPIYMRFQELYDDLPKTTIIYISARGGYYELLVKAALKGKDGGAADVPLQQLRRIVKNGPDVFSLDSKLLSRISWEGRLKPIRLDRFPYGEAIRKSVKQSEEISGRPLRDIIFPVNLGAADHLEKMIKTLHPNLGYLQIFDYGFSHLDIERNQLYWYVAQLDRRYGGSVTNDINFQFLSEVAKEQGRHTKLELQEDLINKYREEKVCESTPLLPSQLDITYIPMVSAPPHLFPITKMKRYKTIKQIASRLERRLGFTQESFETFINELKEKEVIPKHMVFLYMPLSENLIQNFAINLDFILIGLFKSIYKQELNWQADWILINKPILRESLEALGYKPEVLKTLKSNPHYGAFWILTV